MSTQERWKKLKLIVDNYITNEIPSQDANLTTVLCIESTIEYEMKKDCGIAHYFFFQKII